MHRFALFASALSLVATLAAPASAQQGAPPDLVMLRNGGVLRGTIAEMNPGGSVTIITLTGEKRVIAMGEVSYAGPAQSAPGAAPPPAAGGPKPLIQLNARDAPLHLRASQPELTFHLRVTESTGTTVGMGAGLGSRSAMGFGGVSQFSGRTYARICTAPCDATLPAGQYNLAISRGSGQPVETDAMTRFDGPATLQGHYTSYAALRVVGIVVTVASIVTGGYLFITALHQCDSNDPSCDPVDKGRAITGAAILIGGSIVGGILSSKSDESDIVVLPAASGGLGVAKAGVAYERGSGGGPLPGMTLSVRF